MGSLLPVKKKRYQICEIMSVLMTSSAQFTGRFWESFEQMKRMIRRKTFPSKKKKKIKGKALSHFSSNSSIFGSFPCSLEALDKWNCSSAVSHQVSPLARWDAVKQTQQQSLLSAMKHTFNHGDHFHSRPPASINRAYRKVWTRWYWLFCFYAGITSTAVTMLP